MSGPPLLHSSYDGSQLLLRWEGREGSPFHVEITCPNWSHPYATTVHSPEVKLGLSADHVSYRVAHAGCALGEFTRIDSGRITSPPPLPPKPPPREEESEWLHSLGVSKTIADALRPLREEFRAEREGQASLARALSALGEQAVSARLQEAGIVTKLARLLVGNKINDPPSPPVDPPKPAATQQPAVQPQRPAARPQPPAAQPRAPAAPPPLPADPPSVEDLLPIEPSSRRGAPVDRPTASTSHSEADD
ncbi:MAG: hypothetical protein SGPRY_015079 [Prymnesium sp.]